MMLAAIALVLAAPAVAKDVPAPAPTPAPSPAAVAKFNLDTPLETLMADPAANAVVEANLPGVDKHPMYESFKGMSLRELAPLSDGKISDAMLSKIEGELAAIK